MSKYAVNVKFSNGRELKFQTTSNVKVLELNPIMVNGQPCIVTEEEHIINLRHVVDIEQTSLK